MITDADSPPGAPASPCLSLQHTEAVERRAMLAITHYDVALDLASSQAIFGSRTKITFESRGGTTFLDVKPVALHAVRLDGRVLDVGLLDRGRFPLETDAGTHTLVVEADMAFRNDGEGLHRSIDPADGLAYVYGMCFMDAAPSVFACFDQPDLKAPYTLHVRAPQEWTVIGNAPAQHHEPGVWEIGPTQPLSTYFVTLVAGPWHVLRDEHDGIPLSLSCRRSLAPHLDADAEELFTLTKQCFDEYHRLFGIRYPFGDYHQAFVPEFNAGAMENPGCVTYRDSLVFASRVTRGERVYRATTVAHEMAHQWFGNITTPAWWDDLWLNESFAEYMGNRVTADVTEYAEAWTAMAWSRRQWGLEADQRPSTHPVAGNGAVDATAALQDFDGISYAKGSNILRQLAATMGEEVFLAGAIDHFTRHRFGNATMHDLVDSWERAGAGDLSGVVGQWLRTAGPDTFRLERGETSATLLREAPVDRPADRTHTFDLALVRGGADVERRAVRVGGACTTVEVGPDDVVVLDPDHASWGVYVPDETTTAGLVDLLPHLDDEALVAAIWNNLKSGYSVAAVPPGRIIDLVEAAFPALDTEDRPRHTMPWILRDVLPVAPAGSARRVHAAALGALERAATGSELQLSALRAAISTAADVDVLRSWLASPPTGVTTDLDLRWRLLRRLAALGAVERAELDAALAHEPTAASRVAHAGALAARPTPKAKAEAWRVFVGEVEASNYEVEAIGQGFWAGGRDDLTRPYVERYVAELPATASVRSGWNLAVAAELFFPTITDRATLTAVRRLLADGVLVPGLRRRVGDAVDDLERRLAVADAFPNGSTTGRPADPDGTDETDARGRS